MNGFLHRLVARTFGSANVVYPRPELPFFPAREQKAAIESLGEDGGCESHATAFEHTASERSHSAAVPGVPFAPFDPGDGEPARYDADHVTRSAGYADRDRLAGGSAETHGLPFPRRDRIVRDSDRPSDNSERVARSSAPVMRELVGGVGWPAAVPCSAQVSERAETHGLPFPLRDKIVGDGDDACDNSERAARSATPAMRELVRGVGRPAAIPRSAEVSERSVQSEARATLRESAGQTRSTLTRGPSAPSEGVAAALEVNELDEGAPPERPRANVAAEARSVNIAEPRLAPEPATRRGRRDTPAPLELPTSTVEGSRTHDVFASAISDIAGAGQRRARRESDRRPADADREAVTGPAVVNVTIGRIEVRAPAAPTPPPARRSAVALTPPSTTLDAYLRSRGSAHR